MSVQVGLAGVAGVSHPGYGLAHFNALSLPYQKAAR